MEEGSSLGFPMRNGTHVPLESLKLDSNMIWLLLSLCSAIIWVVYISFYNSRVIGYFITKLANRLFIKGAYFKIGSLTMNPLAGKIMFRDVVYICFDYTVRIQDGYVIFRWWRSYVPKDVSEDLSHSDTRLSVMLNGLELHCYNRTELYARLEKTFGLKPTILVPTENMSSEEAARIRDQAMNLENDRQTAVSISENCKQDFKKLKKHKSEAMAATTWRDLIPVIKIDICSGRFVFGNRLTPTTLSICVEEAHCVYSTKPAVSRLDHFMHFVKAKADNAKVLLAPSPKYTGLVDDPPRYMGEGFVVMMSNLLELYFYMDEPGVVPEQPYHFTLSTGDVVEAAPPVWGIDIKCGKGTDFSYGPWADRQRDHLFRFFFPPDWQTMQVTQALKPGEQREYQSFEVSLSTLNEATIDILFSKNKETNATHVTIGAGSYMEVTLPWVTGQNGYTTKVSGQLLHVEATTSLQYRSLAECESLEFKVRIHYPLRWNDHQEWVINLTGCKATAWIVYTHKNFFQDLIEDWASKSRPDILNFVPYTWKFCILLKEFEILMLTNEFNWIDCSSTNQENHHLAFCGDLFDLSFNLPFDDYLPATVPLRFWIHGEGLDLSLYIPEISTSRPIILALDENLRILTRDGQIKRRSEIETKKWRRVCQKSSGWIDCWQVPIVALSIQYVYHPIPPLGPDPQADITTPEKEEILLSPMRMPKLRKSPVMALQHAYDAKKFDPMLMAPDKVSVELEIGSSILIAYGTILRNFIHLKENIFGEDQAFTDMENVNTKSTSSGTGSSGNTKTQNTTSSTSTDQNKSVSEASVVLSGNNGTEEKPKRFDPRLYRPLEVIVSVTIHDIQAHLVKNCNENDPPCPIVLIERLGFEMKKRFQETELQVLVSPSFLICPDNSVRTNKDKHLRQGHLLLSAVQVRGHAMFSNEGRAVHEETLEYAWLLEVQLGKLSGKLSTSQMCHLVTGLETLLMLTMDAENELRPSRTLRYCHHGMPTNECQHTKEETKYKCPSSEDIKYRMTRIAIDAVDLYLVESGTALHTWISPIRLSTCNLHGQNVKSGITALIPTVLVRNFVSSGGHFNHTHFTNNAANNSHSNTNTTGSGRSARLHRQSSKPDDGKEDLNILVSNKKEDAFKCKKESDYGVYRRGSKDKDDSFSTYRRSRESDFQFRRDNDIYASFSCQRRDTDSSEPWLEVGCVSFGPIIMEAASALPIPEHCLNLVQHNYLKIHDDKTKRLWFLWTTTIGETRCGCVGGCAFFGSNRNGARFFKPNPQDLQDAINIARYHIHPNIREYGFGQSLLHEGQLVFHTPPYSLQSISLQENYNPHEAVNGAVRTTVPGRTSRLSSESKSPLPPKHEMRKTAEFQSSNTLTRDKQGQSLDNKMPPSPATLERKSRRFSYTNTRQTAPQPEVPYARLLDSPSKINQMKAANQTRQETESRLLTPKALRMPNSKTSASDSKLTTDYFQAHFSDHQSDFDGPPFPLEMSHSAPQPNPLESDSSEHSLSPRVISEEEIIQVQRTISLTSENPSEAFFSADEDMVNMSRNSACDGSVTLTRPQKKRFASDLSIGGGVGKNDKMSVLISEGSMSNKLSTHRSDYEIHTPEHRSITKMRPQSTAELTENERRIHGLATPLRKLACNNGNSSNVASGSSSVSPRPEFRHFKPVYDPASQESSSGSPSLSSNSFISALSSQEDITLVNLHMQINRPIVDSPLLMASYVTHLTQYRCPNWSSCSLPYGADAFSTPLFQQNEDGGLVYIGSKLLPHFDAHSGTIKNIRIIPRKDCVGGGVSTGAAASSSNIPQQFDAKPHPWDPNIVVRASDSSRASKNVDEDSEFIGGASNSPDDTTATRNSIIVRMKGQVDIMLTPLLLEGLQRLIESATLTLSTLHPLTVVNYLHASCIRKVEAANVLKRDQSLSYWSQVHSNSKRSTAERNLQGPGGPILTDVYEESISTQLQGLVTLPKINITLIQSSVVEEVISFAALDNVQDLSCASLLAVCIDNVSTRFHLGKTTKASMHTVYTQPTIGDRSSGLKKGGLMRGTRALLAHLSSQTRPDNIPGEPVLIETSEKQLEEIVITLEIGKTHAQLRRLKNEGCALQESQTIVTAIPPHRSRAMFECIKSAGSVDDVTAAGVAAVQSASETATVLGYIMFECGLEGVAVKIVKRSQFEKSENSGNDMTAARNELQEQPNDDVITAKKVAINIEKVVSEAAPVKIAKKTVVASANLFLQGVKPTTPKEKFMFSSETASRQKEKDVKDGPSTSSRASLKAVSKDQNIEEDESKKKIEVPPVLAVAKTQENNGRTSSCCIDLRTVWFNFAAPPRAPITRKIDFTRLDWNLLSTASPSITAWMNPSNRFAIKLVAMTRAIHMRRTAVAACLMADALEVQSVQRRVKSRYTGKFTPLSKTLQEDPSCQLCTIMNKLVTEKQVSVIEEMLKQTDLPQLHTLRRGVIVLSRQWKNTLYNPMLFEHQYKNKLSQPINVAFSVPQFDEDCDDAELYDPIIDEEAGFNNAGVLPQTVRGRPLGGDTNDENEMTLLLGGGHSSVEHDIIHQVNTISDSVKVNSSHELNIDARPTVVTQQHTTAAAAKLRKRSVKKLLHPSATNTLSHAEIEYDTLKDGSLPSIGSSTGSLNAEDSYEAHKAGGIKEDLYAWMAKQQQSDDSGKESKTHSKKDDNGESTLQTATSPPRFAMGAPINGYVQDSVKLLDAHLIFEPILSCLGVMPQQMVNNIPSATADNMSASLDSLGTNLSLVGSFDTMRIDIVVSESTSEKKSKPKVLKKGTGSKFSLNMPTETPAFLCERVGVELEVIKVTDGVFPKDDSKPNVLYLSRGQLKKHTSTVINFSLNVRHISQQVNMPLLRLLHQISNMYQNVREAQNELKSQPDTSGKRNTTQMKDESSLASEINDPTLIIDDAQHLLDIEERYDKFNETVFLGHSVSRQSATRIPPLGQLIPLTPSPGGMQRAAGTRPQSFAQKLRSTSKTVKGKLGYTNLSETVTTPTKTSPTSISTQFDHFKVPLDHKSSLSGLSTVGGVNNDLYGDALMGHSLLITPAAAHMLPKCWKTMYHLLDLYASMPETKTVSHRVSISPDVADHHKFSKKYNILNDSRPTQRDEDDLGGTGTPNHQHLKEIGVVTQERTRLVVFGVVKIQKTRLLATLSGLKLEAEIGALHSSATWRKKSRPAALECSLTGQVGRAMIVLLEGVHPNQQTVVKVTVGKSQTLYSSVTRRSKDKNSGLLSIGAINIDIPQHPVALHGMMTRSSKQLSSTLQELRVTRTSTRLSKQAEEPESPQNAKDVGGDSKANPNISSKSKSPKVNTNGLLQPLVMQFNIMLQSLSVTAALLPSLQAQYKMNHVSSTGVSGSKAKFTIDLPSHTLSFTTKVQTTDNQTNLPSEASIALPPVHVSAEYVPENAPQDVPIDGVVLRQGGYVSASAEIGDFDRCLTTDLLNHLVFVQKVFMKEVNEVVQKVYGGEKPVPLWLEDSEETASTFKRILFSLNIKVKRIQLTATTPCNSAVRFETCALELHLSNRVKNLADASHTKLFGKAQIDLNLSLGQIIKNVMFDEAEPEFQQYAFFNTTIGLRNAFQDEMLNDDKELVLITLKRPLIYVQPVAVDKAILVWLNYKNAYEYWAEKRANLNKEVLTATQQVFEKVPFGQFGQHLGAGNLSTLFLQLTVEDMGICLPLNQLPLTSWPSRSFQEFEQKGAVVITLESTIISACNSGSLVSKGKFAGLCLRFADDFETTLDDWKPNQNDSNIMNLCVVSEGTYEVCSRTIAARHPKENAKWFLNVKWQMEGVDIHLDVNIGKQLSALGHTLTTLTGFEEDDPTTLESNDSEDGDQLNDVEMANENKSRRKVMDHFPAYIFDPNIDPRKRSIMMEKEMNEQLKIINDLRTLGASTNTISHEERRLQELQALCYKYFRRDMMQRWKRPSMRKPMLRTSNRSQSFVEPSPTGDIPMMDNVSDIKEDFEQITPRCGPSRSASMRIRNTPQRVTFTDAMRQSSLPSAESEASFPQEELEWESVSYENDCIDVPHMLDIDGEQVELRKKQTLYNQKQQEPNIDFELDIKVLVNSGKCVLHTKDNLTDDKLSVTTSTLSGGMPSGSRHHKRERSIGTDWMREGAGGSPIPSRRNKDKNRIRYNASNNTAVLVDLTIFHIPGLDVKLHYESRTVADESSNRLSAIDCLSVKPKISSKRAALFAWMTLQSIPEETIISPHILEFLEQTLEPIPSSSWKTDNVDPSKYVNAAAVDLLQNNYVTVSSFPVDVIVYFHMQPSTFRFSCLPVSRVECMLQLPSLDIVFSSKRQNQPNSEFDTIGKPTSSSGGGLSVTGCLADFNVYIFHPYGGKKSGIKEAQFSPLADSERKDSLSVNVEFVKFHITRSRKLNFEPKKSSSSLDPSSQRATIRFSTIVDIGTASFKYDMRRLTEILAFPKAWYRRRIVRRLFLGDLSVPQTSSSDLNCTTPEAGKEPVIVDKLKPYSNTEGTASERSPLLVNRDKLNFAENANRMRLKDTGRSSSLDTNGSPSYEQAGQISAWETLVLFAVNFTKLNVQMNMGNVMGNVIWLTKGFRSDGRLSIGSTGHKNLYIGIGLGGSALDAKGGIVGGSFELNKIDTHVHIREEPGVEPKHTVGIELMAMELRLDYMGTSVLMARISSLNATLRDEWKGANSTNKQPTIILIHGDLSWDQLQIMISKSTTADILKIFYKLEEFFSQQFKSSKRVFSSLESRFPSRGKPDHLSSLSKKNSINSRKKNITPKENEENVTNSTDAKHHRHWQHPILQAYGLVPSSLGVPLPKSGIVLGGTMELHGTNISLACFHGINFKAKSWALFSLKDPCINFATEAKQLTHTANSSASDAPTEEQIHIIQTLTFGLGINTPSTTPQHHSMATVCRMSRNVIFPPQFKTLHEWFHYAFANSEIDGVGRFPVLERDREVNTNSIERSRGAGGGSGSASATSNSKVLDHNHNREVVFALPSLQLHFKTDHLQGVLTPKPDAEKPTVECSFITEFEDHIFVTVDADAFFFLHDLFMSYLREKERVIGVQNARSASPNPMGTNVTASSSSLSSHNSSKDNLRKHKDSETASTSDSAHSSSTKKDHYVGGSAGHDKSFVPKSDLEALLADWRHFECKTWHLEPTVRLLSWAGKSIEPYGIDYILNKLGFRHARTTIPKWLQRGVMDPLDKLEAIMIFQLLMLVKEDGKNYK